MYKVQSNFESRKSTNIYVSFYRFTCIQIRNDVHMFKICFYRQSEPMLGIKYGKSLIQTR